MSTILQNAEIELSKQLGDFWEGTTTSASGAVSIVDTSLLAKPPEWITDVSYDMLTSGSYSGEERKISSLSSSTLSVGTHGGSVVSGVTYRVHRLFQASEKRRALIASARHIYPDLYQEVWDESLVSGNWLKDGSFEIWITGSNLTYWTEDTVTVAQQSTVPYTRHSLYSVHLSTAAGSLYQDISINGDLQLLKGKSVTFSCQGWCDTASCLRLSINDGTTQTYSEYHSGGSSWTHDNPKEDDFYVTQTIDKDATEVTFSIHHENASASSFIDDARVIAGDRGQLYTGYLWLAQNEPSVIEMENSNYSREEGWSAVRDWDMDNNGYLHIPTSYPSGYRLRIKGMGYLDFLSSGTSSTSWTSTIAIDQPQLDILIAEAAVYLYSQMSMPNYESGAREEYQKMLGYWRDESNRRRGKFGMPVMPFLVSWGME
jgi:hypothetical protein